MSEFMGHPKRFMANTYRRGDCWEWIGSKRKDGYGRYRLDGRTVLAHRASYYYATGEMPPPEIKVCHECDNHWCVNPRHLFKGSQAVNVADMIAKGRKVVGDVSGERNPQAKLTIEQVEIIRSGKFKGRDLAKQFGVSESTISMVKRGRNWQSDNANKRAEMRL